MVSDPGHYDCWPYIERPKRTWPDGKKIASWVSPNIENYEFEPPYNSNRRAMPRPLPYVIQYSHRNYGNRVGFWRMLEARVLQRLPLTCIFLLLGPLRLTIGKAYRVLPSTTG